MVFKHIQGWSLNHLPGEPIPVLNNPFSKDVFPDIQPKLTLMQLEAISPRPVTCQQWEETNPALAVSTFQILEESKKVCPHPPFPHTKQYGGLGTICARCGAAVGILLRTLSLALSLLHQTDEPTTLYFSWFPAGMKFSSHSIGCLQSGQVLLLLPHCQMQSKRKQCKHWGMKHWSLLRARQMGCRQSTSPTASPAHCSWLVLSVAAEPLSSRDFSVHSAVYCQERCAQCLSVSCSMSIRARKTWVGCGRGKVRASLTVGWEAVAEALGAASPEAPSSPVPGWGLGKGPWAGDAHVVLGFSWSVEEGGEEQRNVGQDGRWPVAPFKVGDRRRGRAWGEALLSSSFLQWSSLGWVLSWHMQDPRIPVLYPKQHLS